MGFEQWERNVYDEILALYEETEIDQNFCKPAIYLKIISVMHSLRTTNLNQQNEYKEVIINALILIVALFFEDQNSINEKKITTQEEELMKLLLNQEWNCILI